MGLMGQVNIRPLMCHSPYEIGLYRLGHKCAIPARSFLILSLDCKVSRYFGIVLSLILNLENLGIDIGIVIEFRLLRY